MFGWRNPKNGVVQFNPPSMPEGLLRQIVLPGDVSIGLKSRLMMNEMKMAVAGACRFHLDHIRWLAIEFFD
jgi:hypothetical protein